MLEKVRGIETAENISALKGLTCNVHKDQLAWNG